jgi:hypothetical protein
MRAIEEVPVTRRCEEPPAISLDVIVEISHEDNDPGVSSFVPRSTIDPPCRMVLVHEFDDMSENLVDRAIELLGSDGEISL